MTLSIKPPYPAFFDRDGRALDNGYIWIGTANLEPITNPIPAYWDEGLSIAAEQPIRTTGGYPSRAGSPAVLYVNGDYSITVQNRVGMLIYTAPSVTESIDDNVVSITLSDLTFTQSGVGAVERTALAKMRDVVTFKDFGAVGNGVTNDTVAIQAAIDSGAKVIDGQGLTYVINAGLTGEANQTLQNFELDATALPGTTTCIEWAGAEASSTPLMANSASGAYSCDVTSVSGFVVDGWAWIKSSKLWSTNGSGSTCGELVRIQTIVGTILNFYSPVICDYNTADAANIAPLQMLENVRVNNVRLIGPVSTGNQVGMKFTKCTNVIVDGCDSQDMDYNHFWAETSAVVRFANCKGSRTGAEEGLDYGVIVSSSCYDVSVDGFTACACRHMVTIGGSTGVNRFIRVVNSHGYGLRDAGIDSHVTCYEHDFSHNFVAFDSEALVANCDGIISQGGLPTIIGNTVAGATRHGIFIQPLIASANTADVRAIIANNSIQAGPNTITTIGVFVQTFNDVAYAGIADLIISDNTIFGGFDYGIEVNTRDAIIVNVLVANNIITGTQLRCIYFLTSSSSVILNTNITGNSLINDGASECIYTQGSGTAACTYVAVTNNMIQGGSYAIRVAFSTKVTTAGNSAQLQATGKLLRANVTELYVFDINALGVLGDIRQLATLAAGVFTVEWPHTRLCQLDTEGGAGTDDLDTISGGIEGQIITLAATSSSRDIVVKDGTGNIRSAGDITLDHIEDRVVVQLISGIWYQLSFSDNGV